MSLISYGMAMQRFYAEYNEESKSERINTNRLTGEKLCINFLYILNLCTEIMIQFMKDVGICFIGNC